MLFAQNSQIYKNESSQDSIIGDDCIIRDGAVIGGEGFSWGFNGDGTPVRFIHRGGVFIGFNVEIGSLCHIARATLTGHYTRINDHVKLDALVHIAHNCVVGSRTMIAAHTMLAGSVTVGEDCWIGPGVNIMNGVTIANRCLIGMGANVIHNITEEGAVVAGNPARILRIHNDRRADSYS